MKAIWKILIITTICTVFSYSLAVADDNISEEQKMEYRQVVKQAEAVYGSYTLRKDENIWYAEGVCYLELKDIDQNGIPELLIVHNSGEKDEYGYRNPENYKYDLWTFQDGKAKFLASNILRYSNGGWPSVCWTEYDGKTYLVSSCQDKLGEEFQGFLEDGTFGTVEKLCWEYVGADTGYLNNEMLDMDTITEEQRYRMENSYGTSLYYENGDQGAQIVNQVKKQLDFAEKVTDSNLNVVMETCVEGHDGYGIIKAYDQNENLCWQIVTPKYSMTEFNPIEEIGNYNNFYYYRENSSIVKLNLTDGSVVWKNTDGAGNMADFVFGENEILYLCGFYGPDFMAIDPDGITIKRIEQFNSTDYWAYQLVYDMDYIDVLMENCASGSGYRVTLADYSYEPITNAEDVNVGENEEQNPVLMEFYGIWCYGAKGMDDSENYAVAMRQNGYEAQVFLTTDWSNLNPEPYWVVTAGIYGSEAEAYDSLPEVQSWCADAYVKYSGKYQR